MGLTSIAAASLADDEDGACRQSVNAFIVDGFQSSIPVSDYVSRLFSSFSVLVVFTVFRIYDRLFSCSGGR